MINRTGKITIDQAELMPGAPPEIITSSQPTATIVLVVMLLITDSIIKQNLAKTKKHTISIPPA
jgi:hypothetical protein